MWKLVLPLLTVLGFPKVGADNFLRYYNARDFNEYTDIPIRDCDMLLRKLRPSGCQNATIISHGFAETLQGGSVQIIVEAYLVRKMENVLAFGYLLEPIPVQVALPDVAVYGGILAKGVECLLDAGIRPHLIGYSFGAQVSGQAGRILRKRNKIVPRITGLDPAGAIFPRNFIIRPEYAEMVDIIHTDDGILGNPAISGTVDFYPNFGLSSQPGCLEEKDLVQVRNFTEYYETEFIREPLVPPPISLCSHKRSYQFYAESVLDEHSFIAIKKFGLLGCRSAGDVTAYMGLATPQSATGCYFLNTKASCPFGNSQRRLSPLELDVLCNEREH